METNNHFASTSQPPLSSASGLKQLPQLVEPVYTNNTLVIFPQQVKGLNCDMPVNGLISPSIPSNPHGTFALGASSTSHPTASNFDYLWKFPKSPVLKDCHGPALPKVNGSASPVSNGPFYKGNSQETWESSTSSHQASLIFNGQDLCNFSNINVKVAAAANGTHCYPTTSQPAPLPMFGMQSPSPSPPPQCQDEQQEMEMETTETMGNKEGLEDILGVPDVQSDETSSDHSLFELAVDPDPVSLSVPSPSPSNVSSVNDPCQLPMKLLASQDLNPVTPESFEKELDEELPMERACSPLCDFKEQEAKMEQINQSPKSEMLDLECPSYSDTANKSPMTDEDQSPNSDHAASTPSELGESVTEDLLQMESPKTSKNEKPESVLESFSSIKMYRKKATPEPSAAETAEEELEPGEVKGTQRRRIATPEEVSYPLLHGWKREVRIRKGSHRWQGETWYYAPCGKRMKQFPEVIKYLSKNAGPYVRREHFSFSPRMPVGDFYEERHTQEGLQWILLKSEEIPSRILAITGKRGRPRNLEKAKAKENKVKRGRGRPPKVKMIDLLNKADAKLLRKLENQDIVSDVEKVQLSKLRKKMRRKARNQEAKQEAAKKLRLRERKEKEKEERENEQRIKEAEQIAERKAKEAEQFAEKRRVSRRQREKTAPVVHKPNKPDRKQLAEQRRLEERRRQQFMLEELKKPTEDMCLPDHQPLPDFPCVPGLVLPSCAFSNCIMTIEFLYAYGKVFGLNEAKDIPSLYTLQEGLFNVGDSQGVLQDLLVKLLRTALFDPGLPSYCQSLKILGEKISEINLTRENVSEVLRIFLEAYGGEIELCESLRTHPFQAHHPRIKAAVLAFIINELNGSTRIISEIDKTLDNMSNYRKNKWIIEGKLRRLKFALGKKTVTQENQVVSTEESRRRRSTCTAEENENLAEDKSGLLNTSADEGEEVSSNASSLDLERQMEKLTKRQMFLRKKIIGCSQRLRCTTLGQDRYRRFYWMLPHIGGIFVEGYSESPGQTLDPPRTELPEVALLKSEVVEETEDKCYFTFSRSRGRPRKPRADSEHCKFCQCTGSQEVPINGLLQSSTLISEQPQDMGQVTVLSWLSQCQNAIMNSTVLTPENSPPRNNPPSAFEIGPCPGATDTDEKENKLYNLLPRTHCTDSSQKNNSQTNHLLPPPSHAAATPPVQASELTEEQPAGVGTSLPSVSALCHLCNKPLRNSAASLHSSTQERRRGRPSRKLFSDIEQKYYNQLIQRPIPEDKKQTWWWIKDPAMLEALIKALHPRGMREKSLHKYLTKHLGHLKEMCARAASDPIFEFKPAEGHPVSKETLYKWSVEQWSFQVDLSVLQWVEDLERRVLASDLQLRGWSPPSLDSIRSDLKYFEHKVDASDDILAKVKREVWFHREPDNPLDLAVLRLLDLEQNVERRYLKEPLWILSEVQHEKIVTTDPETMITTENQYSITSRLRLWRQTVERCRSSAQLYLCLQQLEKSLAWERSVSIVGMDMQLADLQLLQNYKSHHAFASGCHAFGCQSLAMPHGTCSSATAGGPLIAYPCSRTCIYCRKGDNDDCLLLCDSCDRGCHSYCHRPPMTEIPEGDWFCPNCVAQQSESEYLKPSGSSRRIKKSVQRYQDDSPIKQSRRRETPATPQSPAESSLVKKRKIGTRSQSPDLTFCEIILMEMESHDDAWPFLEPVNPRLVPGYRKIIKNPMDFSTMRNKLLNGRYSSCVEFAEDAELVFSNCQLFNEDESDVGKAGLVLKKFYESRWEEFSQERENNFL